MIVSRHVSMYLARHVGRWSYPKISRFYNGRHHTTAIAEIRRIERLRQEDEPVGALLDMLTSLLTPETDLREAEAAKSRWQTLIVDAVSRGVIAKVVETSGEPPAADFAVQRPRFRMR